MVIRSMGLKNVGSEVPDGMIWRDRKWWIDSGMLKVEIIEGLELS